MAKLRPLGDKILVKRVEAESKTKSGIVLPDTAKEKPRRGKVLSVGEGKRLDALRLEQAADRLMPVLLLAGEQNRQTIRLRKLRPMRMNHNHRPQRDLESK
jgi:hypothetical protein